MSHFPRFIGMVHLPALPGAPNSRLTIQECERHAVTDALALEEGRADALIIENFGDVPFRPGAVDPHTIAAMTRIGLRIRDAVDIPIGINVLRNDPLSALGIAMAVGASFIRVNILAGVMVTDQGIISGRADEVMRLRRSLGCNHVKVIADVLVKHATPLGPQIIPDAVEDIIMRSLADAIVISGSGTGKPADIDDLNEAAASAGDVPVYIGSGATAESIPSQVPPAHGAIVGTGLKIDGKTSQPVDSDRVRKFSDALYANLG